MCRQRAGVLIQRRQTIQEVKFTLPFSRFSMSNGLSVPLVLTISSLPMKAHICMYLALCLRISQQVIISIILMRTFSRTLAAAAAALHAWPTLHPSSKKAYHDND